MIEVRSIYDVSDTTLAKMLNDGWAILYMQIMDRIAIDEDDRLNVVLQRTVPAEPPPQQKGDDSIPMSKRLESDDLESDLEDALWDDEDEIGGFPSTYSGEDEDEDEDRAFGFDGSDEETA